MKAVGEGFAEIGIASFMDNWRIAREEKSSFAKRLPLRQGKRGRPRKTERIGVEFELSGTSSLGAVDDDNDDTRDLASGRLDRGLLHETLSGMVSTEIKVDEPFDEAIEDDAFE